MIESNYTSHLNEKELISHLQEGREDAFEFIFRKYYDGLCDFAEHFVKNHQVAEDIVEELFCQLWERANHLIIETSLRGYMYKSVYNQVLRHFRQNKIKLNYAKNQQVIMEANQDNEFAEPLNQHDKLVTKELDEKISSAVDCLPHQCRKIFCLNRFNEMTYNEISKELHLSVNTIKKQMSRALVKLRLELKEYLS